MNNIKVDNDGIPLLVQSMRYSRGEMNFYVLFFNGITKIFMSEDVCSSIGLMQGKPTRMQFLEAQNNIEKYALNNWSLINA